MTSQGAPRSNARLVLALSVGMEGWILWAAAFTNTAALLFVPSRVEARWTFAVWLVFLIVSIAAALTGFDAQTLGRAAQVVLWTPLVLYLLVRTFSNGPRTASLSGLWMRLTLVVNAYAAARAAWALWMTFRLRADDF